SPGGPLRRPRRRPGHAGDAAPHRLPQGRRTRQEVRPDHRRPVLRRQLRHLGRPHLAGSRQRRHHRPGRERRPDPPRRPGAQAPTAGRRRGAGRAPRQDGSQRTPVAAGEPAAPGLGRPARLRPAGHLGLLRRGSRRQQVTGAAKRGFRVHPGSPVLPRHPAQRNTSSTTAAATTASTRPITPNTPGRRDHARPRSNATRPGPANINPKATAASTASYSTPLGRKKPLPAWSTTALPITPRIPAAASGVNNPSTSSAPASTSVPPVI